MTLDKLIIEFDKGLRTLLAPAQSARPTRRRLERPYSVGDISVGKVAL